MTNKKDVEYEIKKFTDKVGMDRKVGDVTREEIQELVNNIVNKHRVDSNKCKTCKNFKVIDDSLFCEHSLDCGMENSLYEKKQDNHVEFHNGTIVTNDVGGIVKVILREDENNFFVELDDADIHICFCGENTIRITAYQDNGITEIKKLIFNSVTKGTTKVFKLIKTKDKFSKCPIYKMLKDGCLECPNADETCLLLKHNEG